MTEYKYKKLPQDLNEERDLIFKIVLIGDKNVGKTQLAIRLSSNGQKASSENENSLGMFWANYEIEDMKVCFQFWDTIADEKFELMCSSLFYKSASCIFLCFSLVEYVNNIFNF